MKTHCGSRATATWLVVLLCFALGCGGTPQIPKSDFQLVAQLRTAVAAKKSDWLESVAKKIDDRLRVKAESDEEHAALDSIIAQARLGQWDEANRRLLDLVNGQRPR